MFIMANNNFKLVPKIDNNIGAIYLVLPNGDHTDILWIRFPNDHQMVDNTQFMESIIPMLRRRIRRSLC